MLQEYEGRNLLSYKYKKYILIILILIDLLCVILGVIFNAILFTIILVIFTIDSILVILILTINSFPQYNKDYKIIKKIGKKMKSNIIDIGFTCHGRSWSKYFYITVLYDEKTVKIYRMKENKEYRILRVLLDQQDYPVIKRIQIPIDIYVYKNKIYADLESVDLSKISGYEEAKKIVKSTYYEEWAYLYFVNFILEKVEMMKMMYPYCKYSDQTKVVFSHIMKRLSKFYLI